jgi:prophage tail gpP-like protein
MTTSYSGFREFPFLFRDGKTSKAILIINGLPAFTGNIEKSAVTESKDNIEVILSGRDNTSVLVDSVVNPIPIFKVETAPKLDVIINSICGKFGIPVINQVGAIAPFTTGKDITPGLTETAWSFIEKLCRQRRIIATSDENGALVLTKPGLVTVQPALIKRLAAPTQNNVLSSDFRVDKTKLFGQYIFVTQNIFFIGVDFGKGLTAVSVDPLIDQKRVTRINAETNLTQAELQARADWERLYRRATSEKFEVKIDGASSFAGLWKPGPFINVDDDVNLIKDLKLINDVEININQSGAISKLSLIDKTSYQV